MFSTRFFVALIIPLVLIGCCLYFVTLNGNGGKVQVAGEAIGPEKVEATVKTCTITQDKGTRELLLEVDVSNEGQIDIDLKPLELQVVLSRKDRLLGENAQKVFQPLSSSSYCGGAPGSQSVIPANTTRSYTLNYWAQTFPEGSEWDDYFVTLECYSSQSTLMLSKPLSVEEK